MSKQQRIKSTVRNEQFNDEILDYARPRRKDDTEYIIQGRDGDYIEAIESTGWTTVPFYFRWTKDRESAKAFTGEHLFSKDGLMSLIVTGFAGATTIRKETQ